MASHLSPRRRRVAALAGVVTALALTVTACGGDSGSSASADRKNEAADAAKDGGGLTDKLPEDLPGSIDDLDQWRKDGWKNWDKDQWLRDAADFVNPYVPDHWSRKRVEEAKGSENAVGPDVETAGATGPVPSRVQAEQVATPYTQNAAPAGKIFMETPKGPGVCSGTVVKDPRSPGKSNLVATAAHCIHGGRSGGWFRNIMFAPAFNNDGLSASRLDGAQRSALYPYGQWWVEWIQTTDYWISKGDSSNGNGAQQDFAVLKVRTNPDTGKSLEETVGAAVKVDFDAPPIDRFAGVSSYGYPAEAPYQGARMFRCTDKPSRYSLDPSQPPMYWIGCTMTGGMSGGGWFAEGSDGKAQLVSVNSLINRPDVSWATGPRLGAAAEGVFDAISKKFAGRS
ncbi:serine protease [Streptomyces sp. JJ36]|uniref:trypsin-like serine peptidase n=1 Tax=Streptomyces sp. JJ36 TaxID=2736645 RepID=UPI001F3522B7|nr:hypothetical protein [Streptomyces sp. JJ36]MCF6523929.1 hypothetical protein [Streptomyces sp. JJ36]